MHHPKKLFIPEDQDLQFVPGSSPIDLDKAKTITIPAQLTQHFPKCLGFASECNQLRIAQTPARTWFPPYGCYVFAANGAPNIQSPKYAGWKIGYHGTSFEAAQSIMGDGKLKLCPPVPGHLASDSLWVSPSSQYATHPSYAKPHQHGSTKLRFVLQILLPPEWTRTGTGGEVGVTVSFPPGAPFLKPTKRVDPRLYNDQLGWWCRFHSDNVVMGLLVFVGDGMDLKLSNRRDTPIPDGFHPNNVLCPSSPIHYVIGAGVDTSTSWKGEIIFTNFNSNVVEQLTASVPKEDHIIASSAGTTKIPKDLSSFRGFVLLLSPVSIPNLGTKTNIKIVFGKKDTNPACLAAQKQCLDSPHLKEFTEIIDHEVHTLEKIYAPKLLIKDVLAPCWVNSSSFTC